MENHSFFLDLQLITGITFSEEEMKVLKKIPKRFTLDLVNLRKNNPNWCVTPNLKNEELINNLNTLHYSQKQSILPIVDEALKFYDYKSGTLPNIFYEILSASWDGCLDDFYGLVLSSNKKNQDIAFLFLTSSKVQINSTFYQRCSEIDSLYGFLVTSALRLHNHQPLSWHKYFKAYCLSNIYPNKERPVVKFFRTLVIKIPKNRISEKIKNISWHNYTNCGVEAMKNSLFL